MNYKEKRYEPGKNLEEWLKEQEPTAFPPFSTERGEKPYPQRYEDLKLALAPIHNNVEKGAMAASISTFIRKVQEELARLSESNDKLSQQQLDTIFESDPIVYLNNHGLGHVDKVIEKVSEILRFFKYDNLSPYEVFILLCAIQLHDVGNIFGREEHEKRIKEILDTECISFIPDSFERKVIERIALVHGGKVFGDKDTISKLEPVTILYDYSLRERLLATLLRFGDELADDSSRADRKGIIQGIIPEESQIYHYYSQALHTVSISENSDSKILQLNLAYDFESNIACKQFKKINVYKYLLDEIYDRTLKIEQERLYCMRFLRPYFSLESIKIEIIIQYSTNSLKRHKIQYTLEESGYPPIQSCGNIKHIFPHLINGKEVLELLIKEGDVHGNC